MDDYIIEGFLKVATKTAQSEMDDEACRLLSSYVAFTRAMSMLHQQNHWITQDYGDHLLFERLYDEMQDIIDGAAERVLGLCGKIELEGSESVIAQRFAPDEESLRSCLESSLAIEKAFQELSKETYNTLKEKEMMTLGLDDMIMGFASEGETHIYLLQQALKGTE